MRNGAAQLREPVEATRQTAVTASYGYRSFSAGACRNAIRRLVSAVRKQERIDWNSGIFVSSNESRTLRTDWIFKTLSEIFSRSTLVNILFGIILSMTLIVSEIGVLGLLLSLAGHVNEQVETRAVSVVFQNALNLLLVQAEQVLHSGREAIQQTAAFRAGSLVAYAARE
jgi:hypothetical protein